MPPAHLDLSEQEIARRLTLLQHSPSDSPYFELPEITGLRPISPRPAAVLIPLLRKEDSWHILFTRRTATLAEHSGQVAFPGGRAEPDDLSSEITALREA